jgi:hypothetical protein
VIWTGARYRPALRPRATAVYVAALFGLSLLIFAGVFFSADSFPGDFADLYYTLPAYWIASVTAGEWPAWIPYVGMGIPLGAIPQSGILYPPLWIFPALHLPYTLKAASVLQVLHVWVGAAGAYALVRRIFASSGVGFVAGAAHLMYGGFYVNAQHTDVVRAFALLPWLFWALWLPVARATLALPLIVFFLITGGYPGQIEALAGVLPIFIVLQLVLKVRSGQPFGGVVRDGGVLVFLLSLGVLLAAAFWLPLGAAWDELTRTTGGVLQPSSRVYLHLSDLYGLVLSSNVVRPDLHRDIGMQLPLALLPFTAFVRRGVAGMLLPFYAIAAFALLMSLDALANVFAGSYWPRAFARLLAIRGWGLPDLRCARGAPHTGRWPARGTRSAWSDATLPVGPDRTGTDTRANRIGSGSGMAGRPGCRIGRRPHLAQTSLHPTRSTARDRGPECAFSLAGALGHAG